MKRQALFAFLRRLPKAKALMRWGSPVLALVASSANAAKAVDTLSLITPMAQVVIQQERSLGTAYGADNSAYEVGQFKPKSAEGATDASGFAAPSSDGGGADTYVFTRSAGPSASPSRGANVIFQDLPAGGSSASSSSSSTDSVGPPSTASSGQSSGSPAGVSVVGDSQIGPVPADDPSLSPISLGGGDGATSSFTPSLSAFPEKYTAQSYGKSEGSTPYGNVSGGDPMSPVTLAQDTNTNMPPMSPIDWSKLISTPAPGSNTMASYDVSSVTPSAASLYEPAVPAYQNIEAGTVVPPGPSTLAALDPALAPPITRTPAAIEAVQPSAAAPTMVAAVRPPAAEEAPPSLSPPAEELPGPISGFQVDGNRQTNVAPHGALCNADWKPVLNQCLSRAESEPKLFGEIAVCAAFETVVRDGGAQCVTEAQKFIVSDARVKGCRLNKKLKHEEINSTEAMPLFEDSLDELRHNIPTKEMPAPTFCSVVYKVTEILASSYAQLTSNKAWAIQKKIGAHLGQ
jgi:hypothetical protein